MATNECGNDDSDILRALYGLYNKLGQVFFKDTSVLLKVINI